MMHQLTLLKTSLIGCLFISTFGVCRCVREIVFQVEDGAPLHIYKYYENDTWAGYLPSGKGDAKNVLYKSQIINDWTRTNVKEVMIKLYKGHNLKAFFQFRGTGTNKLNWLSRNNIMNSSYTDLPGPELHYAMISYVDTVTSRRFYISAPHRLCDGDSGWMLLKESYASICSIDQISTTTILYSDMGIKSAFNNFTKADTMIVEVEIDATCDNTKLQIDNTTHVMTGNQYNDTVTYRCVDGFRYTSGDLLRRCTHLGTWSGSSPVCTLCLCPCKQSGYIEINDTEALEASVKKIKSELSIEVKDTSRAQRMKTCAVDERVSVKAVGGVLGGLVLGGFVLLLIASDAAVLLNHIRIAYRNICGLSRLTGN